jgi:hypothetical protein
MSEDITFVYGVTFTTEPAYESVTRYNETTGKPYQKSVEVGVNLKIGTSELRRQDDISDPTSAIWTRGTFGGHEVFWNETHKGRTGAGIVGRCAERADVAESWPCSISVKDMQRGVRTADVDAFFAKYNAAPEWHIRIS